MSKHLLSRLFLVAVVSALVSVAGAGATTAQPQRFTLYTANVRGADLPVVVRAAGAVSGLGTETQTTKDAKGGQINYVTLRFAGGTLRLLAPERFAWQPDLATCSATANGTGSWKVTGGTGSFRNAAGTGTFTSRGVLLGARDAHGRCLGQRAQPSVNYVTVTLVGSIHL